MSKLNILTENSDEECGSEMSSCHSEENQYAYNGQRNSKNKRKDTRSKKTGRRSNQLVLKKQSDQGKKILKSLLKYE